MTVNFGSGMLVLKVHLVEPRSGKLVLMLSTNALQRSRAMGKSDLLPDLKSQPEIDSEAPLWIKLKRYFFSLVRF
jgi:hypothetical protein